MHRREGRGRFTAARLAADAGNVTPCHVDCCADTVLPLHCAARTEVVVARHASVVVVGEILCDLFAAKPTTAIANAGGLRMHLGGAPSNVAVQLARLSVPTAIVSAVGDDPFGDFVLRALTNEGVDVSTVLRDRQRRTGCTLVELNSVGDRTFYGYRAGAADLALTAAHGSAARVRSLLRRASVLHFGTVLLRSSSARALQSMLIKSARIQGKLLSLDVNLRPGMFVSASTMLSAVSGAVARAHVVKATREEAWSLASYARHAAPFARVFGRRAAASSAVRATPTQLAAYLLAKGARLSLLTLGDAGCVLATRSHTVHVKGKRVRAVDATGAGDAFMGAALAWLVRNNVCVDTLDALSVDALHALGTFACRAGGAAVGAVGATSAMVRGVP